MLKVLSFIWQLPQNILALMMILCFKLFGNAMEFSDYKGVTYVWVYKWYNGVSLGNFVILGWYYNNPTVVNHEYGHTRQSLIFGPLYLLLIGLPSITWNIIDRILTRISNKWTSSKSYKTYYSMPWEHGADVLGGVERYF